MNNEKVTAAIITIGDEILIGQIVDTNSAWLGQELGKIGIRVVYRTSVGDNQAHILQALQQSAHHADIIITTGGLGPTKDDVTKSALCSYFDTQLVMNNDVLSWVTSIFSMRKLPLLETNKMQALVPESCEVLFNRSGTAPGIMFKRNGKMYVSMPGVPFEMKAIFEEHVISKIKDSFTLPSIIHRTIQTCSIGESFLAEKIKYWEEDLPDHIQLAYLPSVGQVRLRLSAYGSDYSKLHDQLNEVISSLYTIVGEYIFGEENDSLPHTVGMLLNQHKSTIATAESCTGGYLAHLITSVPGSSSYYKGSIVAYANEIKTNLLGVSQQILESSGAVSELCVQAMANEVRKRLGTSYGIATSGVAGPSGGTETKPVGTVWIAVCSAEKTITKQFNMGDNRERTIQRTALQALDMLRKMLLEEN